MFQPSYKNALLIAVSLHIFLAIMLFLESMQPNATLVKSADNKPGQILPNETNLAKPEIVNAVSVDNQEVMKTVNRLKQERLSQLKAEQERQQNLVRQAAEAKQARVQEQQRLAKIKEQAETIATARKKEMAAEKLRLQQLTEQKIAENEKIEALKKKRQQLEQAQKAADEKAAALKKSQVEQQKLAEKAAAEQRLAEQVQAQERAAQQAKMAGEVDKYKALIINAISQRWILPENTDRSLSSQFKIRLAPDGAVLNVSLIRSSGDSILDRSAQAAIYKASPLPVPMDPDTFDLFREISLTVRPENSRG